MRTIYLIIFYIRKIGLVSSIFLVAGIIYLFATDTDNLGLIMNSNSNYLIILFFCLISSLMFLRGKYIQDYFNNKSQEVKKKVKDEKQEISSKKNNSLLDELTKLGNLKEKGLLTQEEFNEQKKKLLK